MIFKMSYRSTSSAFQVSSKDPEQSLTDYVAHLEAIQQRLGILMLGKMNKDHIETKSAHASSLVSLS